MNYFAIILTISTAVQGCKNSSSGSTAAPAATEVQVNHADSNESVEQYENNNSGSLELKGKLLNPQTGQIFLWETRGKNTNKIDSTSLTSGVFSFGKKSYETGVYMLGLNESNMCSIILNPQESLCEIGFRGGMLEQSMYAINSKENDGWAKYMLQEMTLLKAIKDARVAAYRNPTMKAQFDEQALLKEKELLDLQNKLIAEYPNTHLAKILGWKQEPNKAEIGKYWDNIDFADETIIRSKVLSDRIESFMRTFSKGEESGFINCIATVVDKAKKNDKVLEFSLNQMLVGFYESGLENMCTFIIDNYINGDACGDADLSNVIKSTAESIANLGIGKTPPNINLVSSAGANIDLYDMAAAHKYTLVMFWSSWCEHCKGEAPEVVACYNNWHSKGFEILGVSIDRSKAPWEAAIKERGFTFPNVCGMKEYQSQVAKDYRITKTPSFFLLDKDKKIVLKPKGIKEIQAFLKTKLS